MIVITNCFNTLEFIIHLDDLCEQGQSKGYRFQIFILIATFDDYRGINFWSFH